MYEGSPPRVRSRHTVGKPGHVRPRITSACAEQTEAEEPDMELPGDHLRVCGADFRQFLVREFKEGSPPRVRSRHVIGCNVSARPGITSACAEQTESWAWVRAGREDHLRVCGADQALMKTRRAGNGSPPRVRSRHPAAVHFPRTVGITSACAEQTAASACPCPCAPDHLRVCGADQSTLPTQFAQLGSPPRVRSRLESDAVGQLGRGITSACAEQTALMASEMFSRRDHLRVCGADTRHGDC